MKKHSCLMVLVMAGICAPGVTAQPSMDKKVKNVAELKEALKSLNWQAVDYAALDLLEKTRALALLDHALNEIGAVATAEADLMSEYLDQQDIGVDYVSSQPEEAVPSRTYEDGQRIAAALLQGPMANSKYATMFESSGEASLKANLRMNESSGKRKWKKFAAPVRDVRGMKSYLKSKGKYSDYLAWSNTESGHRQREHEQAMASVGAEAKARADAKKEEQLARAEELADQRRQEEENRLAQQALYAQSMSGAQGGAYDDSYDDYYPTRYYGYGTIAHLRRWHRDGPQQVRAAAQTQTRMKNWRGTAGVGRKGTVGGGRRGGGGHRP